MSEEKALLIVPRSKSRKWFLCMGGERRMTAEERAEVLNAIQEAIEKYGLIVTGYDDCCNVFEVVMMVAERKEE